MSVQNPVDAKYLRESAKLADALKLCTYDRMQIRSGDTVLDAGCGVGVDTIRLVDRVGPDGKVVGLDYDAAMLAEADKTIAEHPLRANISHEQGSVLTLPYGDATYDAVRAERLIQVLPAQFETAIVDELARTVKPGGRLVLADTDWGSASVSMGDDALERRLVRFLAEQMRPNGYAGRNLYRQMGRLGFTELTVDLFPMASYDLAKMPFGGWLAREALASEVASADEIDGWLAALGALDDSGQLMACVNMVVVSGRRPATV